MSNFKDRVDEHFGVLDCAPLGMFVLNKAFIVVFWNKRLARWSGVDASDIVGKDIRTVFAHLNDAEYKKRIATLFTADVSSTFQPQLYDQLIPCQLPNGELRVQKTTATLVPSWSKDDLFALFSIEDFSGIASQIKEFKKMRDKAIDEVRQREIAEEEIKTQNRVLNSVLSASPVGIALIENNRLQWANSAILEIFGLKSEDGYKEHSIEDFYSSREEYLRVSKEIQAKAAVKRIVEIDAEFKRGKSVFTGHIMMSCVDKDDFFKKIIVTVFDLTSRINAEKDRMHKEKLEGVLEMAGAVCHEMNQPVMAINCYSELLMNSITEGNPAYDKVNKIFTQSKRIGKITRKLMTLTRYEIKNYTHGEKIVNIETSSDE